MKTKQTIVLLFTALMLASCGHSGEVKGGNSRLLVAGLGMIVCGLPFDSKIVTNDTNDKTLELQTKNENSNIEENKQIPGEEKS